MVETPNAVTICQNLPYRHVQVVTLLKDSLLELMYFVDTHFNAMAFDGKEVLGCSRSLRALRHATSLTSKEMTETREDTTGAGAVLAKSYWELLVRIDLMLHEMSLKERLNPT